MKYHFWKLILSMISEKYLAIPIGTKRNKKKIGYLKNR